MIGKKKKKQFVFRCKECNTEIKSNEIIKSMWTRLCFSSKSALECPNCGVSFADETYECPMCRAIVSGDSNRCDNCGAEFEIVDEEPSEEEKKKKKKKKK